MIWPTCLFALLALSCCDAHIQTGTTFQQIQISIEELQKDFNISNTVPEGGPIFIDVLESSRWAQPNDKKIILGQLISMYLEMFKNMSINKSLRHIKDVLVALEKYKNQYIKEVEKAEDLLKLAKLPMNDVKNQFKAILELDEVLREVNKEEVRRRRRSRAQNPPGQRQG